MECFSVNGEEEDEELKWREQMGFGFKGVSFLKWVEGKDDERD